ncbi:MAG: DNA/RNA non-specific endonuclease [Alphaproteobacteria bacterium]
MKLSLLATTIAVAVIAFAQDAPAASFQCSNTVTSPFVPVASAEHDHLKYAPAIVGADKEFRAYHAVFDDDDDDNGDGTPDLVANPTFVSYELKGVLPNSDGKFVEPDLSVKGNWYRSNELASLWAPSNIAALGLDPSYSGIGTIWNRGHLAMNDHAQRIGAEAACNTFHFWNASPQAKDFNQGPWRHLETYTAAAANKWGSVWIIAGPIFDKGKEILFIGESDEVPVAVPHAFFKIIVIETASGPEARGFIFEHPSAMGQHNGIPQPLPDATWVNCNQRVSQGHSYDHMPHLRSMTEIAYRTGLNLFANRSPAERNTLMLTTQTEVWEVHDKFWDVQSACGGQNYHP